MVRAKNYENMCTFVKIMQKKLWPLFFRTRCTLLLNDIVVHNLATLVLLVTLNSYFLSLFHVFSLYVHIICSRPTNLLETKFFLKITSLESFANDVCKYR